MAKLIIGERCFEIAPYKLGALRKAAPHIDAINAAGAIETIEDLIKNAEHIVAILSIGLQKDDRALTPEALDDMIGADDMAALGAALRDVLAESGLAPKGEVPAPAEPTEAAGA